MRIFLIWVINSFCLLMISFITPDDYIKVKDLGTAFVVSLLIAVFSTVLYIFSIPASLFLTLISVFKLLAYLIINTFLFLVISKLNDNFYVKNISAAFWGAVFYTGSSIILIKLLLRGY